MYKIVNALVFSSLFLLTACGGGSSSGGGGGSTMFAGTYNGTETLTIVVLGQSEMDSGPVTITITANGAVTVVDGLGVTYRGNLSGTGFTASGGTEGLTDPSLPGVVCDANQTYKGNISGDTISGSTSGGLTCTQGGSIINGTVSGNFTAMSNS